MVGSAVARRPGMRSGNDGLARPILHLARRRCNWRDRGTCARDSRGVLRKRLMAPTSHLRETVRRAKLRLLQMHYESRVGHIGGNLPALDILITLYHQSIGPDDALVLSKGHAAGALYIALWSRGLIPEVELQTFHRDDTRLSGHPPTRGIPEILF